MAHDNGVEFARSTFTVTTTGEDFLTGANARSTVEDFPSPGEMTVLEWNQSTQHFEMISVSQMSGRSLTDRPDGIRGAQIHIIYVLPSAGVDEGLDTNGTIETSLTAIQNYLSRGVSRQLRPDTFRGRPDITFFRSALTDTQMAAKGLKGLYVRDQIERELSQAGRLSADKLHAVYYGGKHNHTCGDAARPPDLAGVAGALYLNGEPPGAHLWGATGVPPERGALYLNGEPPGAPPCNTGPILGISPTNDGPLGVQHATQAIPLARRSIHGCTQPCASRPCRRRSKGLDVRWVPALATAIHRHRAERLLRP